MTRRPCRAAQAVLVCTLALTALVGCATPGPATSMPSTTPSVTLTAPSPTTTPPSDDTERPEPTPSAAPTPAGAMTPTPLIGDNPYVVRVDHLNVRGRPGLEEPVQTVGPGAGPYSGTNVQLAAGTAVWVMDTVTVDGARWYQVIANDAGSTIGWISAGPEGDPWVVPFDRAKCPASPNDAVDSGFMGRQGTEALACFGGGQLAIVVYWPTPDEAQIQVPCPWSDQSYSWEICYEIVNKRGDGTPSLAVYGTNELPDFERGQWWTVTGHLDDPRSVDCPDPAFTPLEAAASILWCRTRFVVDSVEWPPVP